MAYNDTTWTTDGLTKATNATSTNDSLNVTGNLTSQMSTALGIDTGLQECITSYVKARLYEDMGDLQKAQYFRVMYEKELKKYPSRKSGVRALSVPHM